jgi:autotransporter-associated beta strand protein
MSRRQLDPDTLSRTLRFRLASFAAASLVILAAEPAAKAQAFSFTPGNLSYAENFDSMGATGITLVAGWTTTDPTVAVGTGSSNAGGIYNVGSAGAPDRALGSLGSGTQVPLFGASFVNATGATIDSLLFNGAAEQWRTGSNSVIEINPFEFSLTATALDDNAATWIPLAAFDLVEKLTADNGNAAVDGNDPNNRTALHANATVTWTQGATLWIRWREIDHAGSDGLYAIDDFSFGVTTAAPPLYWDANGSTVGIGGAGTWDAGTLTWTTDSNGATNPQTFDPNRAATFAGVAGNVQVATAGIVASAGITLATAGYIINGGPITLGAGPVLAQHATGLSAINSSISGTSGFQKTGAGTLLLGGANTFSGTVRLNEGTLEISADENLGALENDVQFGGGTLAFDGDVTLNVGRNLGGAGSITIHNGGTVTVNGSFQFTSVAVPTGGTLVLAGTANSIGAAIFAEPVTITGTAPVAVTTSVTTTHATGMSTWRAPLSLASGAPEVSVNDGTGPVDLLIDGVISGVARLLKIGDGTMRLTRDNANWSGSVRLGVAGTSPLNGGRIIMAHQNALGTGSNVQMQFNDGVLEAETPFVGANAIPLGLSIGPGFLSGVVFAGADMEFTGIVQLFRPAGTSLQHTIVLNNHVTFAGPFASSTSTGSSTGITLSGAGSLTLMSSNNDVTEPVSIEGATLILAGGVNAQLGSGSIAIKAGSLRGEGHIHDVIVGDSFGEDAELSPGNPLGALIAGNVSFDTDATLRIEINSAVRIADQLRANGMVALGNGVARLVVTDVGGALLPPGTEFSLIDNESIDLATTGFFAGLIDGAQLQVGLNSFAIDYAAGSNGNDVILRAIPEPGSAALTALSALIVFSCSRLNRRLRPRAT